MGLEDIVHNEATNKGWLARKLNSPKRGLIGKILDFSVGIAATAVAYSLIGTPALVGSGIGVVGDYFGNLWRGAKTSSAQIRDSLFLSSIVSPIGYGIISFLDSAINIRAPLGLVKRTLTQIIFQQGMLAPAVNHLDYMLRHKTLDIKEAYERQFKKFFFKNIGWSVLAGLAPVGLAYQGYGVNTQFYGGLLAGVAVRGLAWGKQIAATDPYGTHRNQGYGRMATSYS